MTNRGMAALRRATTLVHALGGIDLRLLHAGKVMIAVGSGPGDRDGAVGRCGWRVAVADANRQLESGAAVCFLHLDPGVDPVVELVPEPRCRAVGTDIYRLQIGTSLVDAFATTPPQGPGRRRRWNLSEIVPVRFAPETLEALRAAAEADDRSVSSSVRRAVEHELRQRAG